MEHFELEPYKQDTQIIQETCDQIIKDFNMTGLHIDLPLVYVDMYQDLLQMLRGNVAVLLERDQEGLYNLLYRVDIQPAAIQKARYTEEHTDDAELIASMIIYRAFQKIMFRRYFKNH